jgi:hypothetical protein
MITHCVLFSWKPEIPDGQLDTIIAGLSQMPERVPSIRDYRFGANLGVSPGSSDFAVVATFDDVDGWRAYDQDEFHDSVRKNDIVPWVASRTVIQFER